MIWINKRVGVVTLGCARNVADSEKICADIAARGGSICDAARAQTIVVNTCGFTEEAKRESLEAIAELLDLKTKGKVREVVVRGCLVARYAEELNKSFPGVDEFGGLAGFKTPGDALVRLTPRHWAYMKISEGCANRCSFCAIPLIKGPLSSRPAADVVSEAKVLEEQGVRELNIIGQDITLYGADQGSARRRGAPLVRLLKKILKATGIPWIRLLYLHPRRIPEELLDLMASEPRICPYIDVPLQHINDRILRAMRRMTTKKEIYSLIDRLRHRIEDVTLRTSVIVGFPSETKKEFQELCSFVRDIRFDRLGVFTYSREEGTPAYGYAGQVAGRIKRERRDTLMALQQDVSQANLARFIGKDARVLIDGPSDKPGVYEGRRQADAVEVDGVVLVRSKKPLKAGAFVTCRITSASAYDLAAEVAS